MIEHASFLAGSLALLATPGPTNTLLATAGATRGFRSSLALLLGELAGYLIAIAVLIAALGPVLAAAPEVGLALRLAIALYLLYLAWAFWRHGGAVDLDARPVTVARVLVTTLLNPKAAIFAFGIIPAGASGDLAAALPWIALLSVLIVSVGTSWIGLGALAKRGFRLAATPELCYRVGAVALLLFAGGLGISVLEGA